MKKNIKIIATISSLAILLGSALPASAVITNTTHNDLLNHFFATGTNHIANTTHDDLLNHFFATGTNQIANTTHDDLLNISSGMNANSGQ